MNSGEITGTVAIVGMALSYFGYNIDPQLINGAVAGLLAIVTLGSAIYSAYVHSKNQT